MKILMADEIFKGGNLKYEYNEAEDLEIIGNIPANAKVEIKGRGSSNVIINGQSLSFASSASSTSIINGVTYINGQRINTPSGAAINGISIGQECANLTITGNVGQGARISSISSNITVSGDIKQGARIKTTSGDVSADIVHSNAEVETVSGDINANTAYNHARIKTISGSIRINNDERSRRESRRGSSIYNQFNSNFGANLNSYINSTISAAFSHPIFSSNSASSRMSRSDSEDDSIGRSTRIPQRQMTQLTAQSMAASEDLPPSYEEVMGSNAAAAAGSPSTYSEMPKEGETRVASNLSSSTASSPLNNSQRRR